MKQLNRRIRETHTAASRVSLAKRLEQALSMILAIALVSYPVPSSASELIGVAKITGTAERNGLPLPDGSNVFSGDVLRTGERSALVVSSAPQERLWLAPDSSVQLIRYVSNVVINLKRGTLAFQSQGQMQVGIEGHDFAIRSGTDSPALAQLTFVNDQEALVWLLNGSMQIIQAGQSVVLQAEQSGLVSAAGPRLATGRGARDRGTQAVSNTQANTGSVDGKVVSTKLFAVPNAIVTLVSATGVVSTTKTDSEANFAFSNVPAGSYTLRVVHGGFQAYEMQNLVVGSGRVSSLFIELKEKTRTGLIIGVIAGAAGAGIGTWLAVRGKQAVSPSSAP